MANRKPLRFEIDPFGCYIVTSHKLNQDGYFRKMWADGPEMFHRTMWRLHHGDIPAGYEVDHTCGNRACCNVEHLRILPKSEHKVDSNSHRYAHRREVAQRMLRSGEYSKHQVAEHFSVSLQTVNKWGRTH